ncbi:MAG: hypoxanthine phosphoribosyltransferase [Desulfonauticus sp.]|nr:hypoxanthine phosphoribosyltransferase [Desulfonauticus sp.]
MHCRPVFTSDVIQKRVKELGRQLTRDYKEKDLVVVCVLKGAFVFFSDLVRQIDLQIEMDFVRLSSYHNNTSSSGKVLFLKDMELSVEGKHLLLVEDIVDSGRSMAYLKKVLEARQAKSIKICALIDKKERREVDVLVDYVGFEVKQGFLVGYGLDYAEKYRNLPDVCELIF